MSPLERRFEPAVWCGKGARGTRRGGYSTIPPPAISPVTFRALADPCCRLEHDLDLVAENLDEVWSAEESEQDEPDSRRHLVQPEDATVRAEDLTEEARERLSDVTGQDVAVAPEGEGPGVGGLRLTPPSV